MKNEGCVKQMRNKARVQLHGPKPNNYCIQRIFLREAKKSGKVTTAVSGGGDRKKRMLDGFAPADRASARLLQAFPFPEHKAAFHAFCRIYFEVKIFFEYRLSDMFKMVVYLFF